MPLCKYKWNDAYKDIFLSELVSTDFTMVYDVVNIDVGQATKTLITYIQKAADKMCVNTFSNKIKNKNQQPLFWCNELEICKREKYTMLNKFKCTNKVCDLEKYRKSRAMFKNMFRAKKYEYKNKQIEDIFCEKDVNKFWKSIKMNSNNQNTCSISPAQWKIYFESLLDCNNSDEEVNEMFVTSVQEHDINCDECYMNNVQILNGEITPDEILSVINELSNDKAPGVDGLSAEFYKYAKHVLLPHLCILFNSIFDKGVFPTEWCKAIICPLHKSGNRNDTNNYRGISLLCTVSKIFTKILCKRFEKWGKEQDKLFEEQSGFRKGYSTADNIFSLSSVIQKYLSKSKGRFYCLYVDFAKAFDCINHIYLFYKLSQQGVHGKMYSILKNMYLNLEACVKVTGGLSEAFKCNIGTRQGCMLSPFLFSLYLNTLIETLIDKNCQGVFINNTIPNLCTLLYADDLVMISDSIGRVQSQINSLTQFCKSWGMKVNFNKTKVIVFKKGGIVKQNEKLYYEGKQLEVVSQYKYLGLLFTPKLSWAKATKTLSLQAEKALFNFYKFNCNFKLPVTKAFQIFDKMILPILLYGSEIWGYTVRQDIEKVHLLFCKRLLGASTNTSDLAVLGETGRLPLHVHYYVRCIKYWLRILNMSCDRIPKNCYSMLYKLDQVERKSWVSNIKEMLYKYGFGIVWLEQGVGNINKFISEFKQRVKDCARQEFFEKINNSSKLSSYCTYKSVLELEKYLTLTVSYKYKNAFCKLRCSTHNLNIETGRHSNTPREERYCKYCESNNIKNIETEFHFIMECKLYVELRKELLPENLYKNPCINNFINLMSSNNSVTLKQLTKFVYEAFIVREMFLCTTN